MKKNEIPVPEPAPDEYELPSAARTEMTGRVQTPPKDIPPYQAKRT